MQRLVSKRPHCVAFYFILTRLSLHRYSPTVLTMTRFHMQF